MTIGARAAGRGDLPAWRPGARRPGIDVARVLALVVVVLGHLTLAVIDRGPDGALRGANLLALHPSWLWLGVASPMPVFFAAAGWANSSTTLDSAAPRLRTLVGLGAAVVTIWVAALAATVVVTGSGGTVADGARLATQPLWFLAAYVPLAAASPFLVRAGARPVMAVGSCLALLAVLDLLRFAAGGPNWIGWPGFAAAWATPWLLGMWWRQRCEAGEFHERRVGAATFVVGLLGCVALIRFAHYTPSLIDAVRGRRSNTTPPTLFTAAACIAQVGVFMVVASTLDRIGVRWSRWWANAGEVAVAVYVLHLSALALCAALVAAGVPLPDRSSALWWVTRPVWWVIVLSATGALVAAANAIRIRLPRAPDWSRPRAVPQLAWLGVLCATVGAATIGLRGPRTPLTAVVCVAGLVVGWWLLGAAASVRNAE